MVMELLWSPGLAGRTRQGKRLLNSPHQRYQGSELRGGMVSQQVTDPSGGRAGPRSPLETGVGQAGLVPLGLKLLMLDQLSECGCPGAPVFATEGVRGGHEWWREGCC